MKKILTLLLSAVFMGTFAMPVFLTGCTTDDNPPDDTVDTGGDLITDQESIDYVYSELYSDNQIADETNGFATSNDVKAARYFVNGSYADSFTNFTTRQDVKLELYNEENARLVNVSAGYAFTLPTTGITADYSIASYRVQYSFADSVLTVSNESSNPYTSNSNPWYIYCGEWLITHINSDTYLEEQNLTRINGTTAYEFTEKHDYGDLTIKDGYDVYRYDILIEDNEGIEYPYYNIAIIREVNDQKNFALFVMKSDSDQSEVMDLIVQSFTRFSSKGVQKNYFNAGTPIANPNWNDETAAYYDYLCNSDSVDWGIFSYSMTSYENSLSSSSTGYQTNYSKSKGMQNALEEALDFTFDIYPTYTGMVYGGQAQYFPLEMALELAGGNGTNGKPVLQFTYQYVTGVDFSTEITPVFDIMRGKYDNVFHRLAQDIKAYGYPVLFRLNNEMNTDWTTYCGMMTLLDPDIFIITWQRLYEIFEEEGVDNAIWIWNPVADSCPYSSWGEDLCYFPGVEYVQLLGGTSYEMNNYAADEAADSVVSFEEHYSSLYEKNQASFSGWSMILSEFACGSGGDYSGELGRNAAVQAQWVTDMFECLNAENKADWVKSIKGAIWFNCNDYSGDQITNRLRFLDPLDDSYSDLAATVAAFRAGFAAR